MRLLLLDLLDNVERSVQEAVGAVFETRRLGSGISGLAPVVSPGSPLVWRMRVGTYRENLELILPVMQSFQPEVSYTLRTTKDLHRSVSS